MTATQRTAGDPPGANTVPAEGRPTHRPDGRHRECDLLDALVGTLWTGESQVLLLRGDEGVGKTALLDYLAAQATGCRVIRAAGIESERELTFAGLHQLCAPFLARLGELPESQREVLGAALGMCGGEVPDRFVIGIAVMGLLTSAAAAGPLVCIVNDLQWFDEGSLQILGFVSRRLANDPVALVMSLGNDTDVMDLTGITELVVDGLDDEDARSFLRSAVVGPLDARVEERIAAEARGNPLTLRQTATAQALDDLAGGYGLPRVAIPVRMQARFRRQLAPLSPATRLLVLLAAAEPTGDAVLLWSAASKLGITTDAVGCAVSAGILELDEQVRFCHPLLRSVVYESASSQRRRAVHRALADSTDPNADPDGRAWHRAQSAADVDEESAAELERAATRAQGRGGLPAFAAFLARSAELTADPACRAKRALSAAETKQQAGSLRGARRMLAMAQAGPLDTPDSNRARLLEARLAAHSRRGADTSRLLLKAAEGLDPAQTWRAHRDALIAAMTAGRLGSLSAAEVGAVVRSTPAHGPEVPGMLLQGLATMASEGPEATAPLIKHALQTLRDGEVDGEDEIQWLSLACLAAQEFWDDRTWSALATRLIHSARRTGALAVLPDALNFGSVIQLVTMGCSAARPLALEAEAVGQATGDVVAPYGRLLMVAWQGRLTELSRVTADATTRLMARGEGRWLTVVDLATAVANNSAGQYHDAMVAAEHGTEFPEETGFATWCSVELIEAAVRVGDPERASQALKKLLLSTEAGATDWARGIAARAQALLTDGDAAEALYLNAIDSLGSTCVRADLGRAHLLYGEWLRRQGRRIDAREQLRNAHELLVRLGADGFAERARRELVATGGTPRRRTPGAANVLTPQEVQIARMARDGRSNAEIGGELYISHRTVEWHLRKVFMKLGITSRRQLDKAIPS